MLFRRPLLAILLLICTAVLLCGVSGYQLNDAYAGWRRLLRAVVQGRGNGLGPPAAAENEASRAARRAARAPGAARTRPKGERGGTGEAARLR